MTVQKSHLCSSHQDIADAYLLLLTRYAGTADGLEQAARAVARDPSFLAEACSLLELTVVCAVAALPH